MESIESLIICKVKSKLGQKEKNLVTLKINLQQGASFKS